MASSDKDIIAAIATAPGRAGIGVVRLSGGNLETLIAAICRKPLIPRLATLSQFSGNAGDVIDTGLALSFPAPNSYTEIGRAHV